MVAASLVVEPCRGRSRHRASFAACAALTWLLSKRAVRSSPAAVTPCLRGVYCVSRSQQHYEAVREYLGAKLGTLPIERWQGRENLAQASAAEVADLFDSGMVLPQALPYSLVHKQLEQDDYNQWRESLRREDRWEDVRHSRDAPRRPEDGWISSLDHSPETLARAVSHLELWSELANHSDQQAAFIVLDENCSFTPGFDLEMLQSRLSHVPSDWQLLFLGGVDVLGLHSGDDYQVADGVRRLYPWFLSRMAPYIITVAGAKNALKTCMPLRWRLDCQLAGYHSFLQKDAEVTERIEGPLPDPIYCLVPPLASPIETGFSPAVSLSSPVKEESKGSIEELEEQLNEELDAVIAWAMRLTDIYIALAFWCPHRTVEGHTNMIPESRQVMRELAQRPGIKRICEIGFNGGHSALRWLLYTNATIDAFDLGSHEYARPAATWLAKRFPERLNVTWGDSMEELPKFVKKHPEARYEFIFIDGGHDYNIAKSDLKHCALLANPEDHRILMDDTNIEGPEKIWDEWIAEGKVVELARYQGKDVDAGWDKATFGFSVGYYRAGAMEARQAA
eukprot:TRINITY_DN33191_c0_g1_i1.p1 TRINITY_DN33191_c0_g1~~TRINITY_DN33191_c0_g1_i1.p1  ORF type:complete len:577 (-),score=91.63 TRINITY_DN33191_c0_g1_i1:104-1795(-)